MKVRFLDIRLQNNCIRDIHVFVNIGNVLVEVLSDGRKLSSVRTDHTEFVNLIPCVRTCDNGLS